MGDLRAGGFVLERTAPAEGRLEWGGDRRRRLTREAALWHLFARGIRRLEFFPDEADFTRFNGILSFGISDSDRPLLAWVLIGIL